MKISKYTFFHGIDDNCTVLYNCRNEAIAVVENELAELLQSSSLDDLQARHASFYSFLAKEGFIVSNGNIEEDQAIKDWEKNDRNKKTYSIFINPTLDCNLCCWYCYEKHIKDSLLNEDVMHSVWSLIKNKINVEKIENLSISFFGGEPFLALDSVVLPLLLNTSSLCCDNACKFSVSFVTNGTLLSQNCLEKLSDIKTASPMLFQITLDGNEYFHNKTKSFKKDIGSYKLVIKNIKNVLSYKMKVTLRFNMTKENLMSYYDVLPDLQDLPQEEKKLINIDLQHVWQDNTNDSSQILQIQKKIREAFLEQGFNVNELKHIDPSRCYADLENHVTINYNGDLYKCTARDFTESNREGILMKDGTLAWNEKYHKRMLIKYGNAFCRKCSIYPLCHGGCSQYKMDRGCEEASYCIRGYSDIQIKKIVEDRIHFLLERIINFKKY